MAALQPQILDPDENPEHFEILHVQHSRSNRKTSGEVANPEHQTNLHDEPLVRGTQSLVHSAERCSGSFTSSPPKMTFSSSPVLYPPSSSPPPARKKRRLFQSLDALQSKRTKLASEVTNYRDKQTQGTGPEKTETILESLEPDNVSRQEQGCDSNSINNFSSTRNVRQRSPSLPPLPGTRTQVSSRPAISAETCSGHQLNIPLRQKTDSLSFEQTIAQRSVTAAGRAKKAYYGIDIHDLLDKAACETKVEKARKEAAREQEAVLSIEMPLSRGLSSGKESRPYQMWTEKYRAKKFTDLIGDERTHRSVLKWLKGWDPVVFPGSMKAKPKHIFEDRDNSNERQHRKILLLTGPPGLGKTTLAHVCAKQAGYEVLEINASDDRSRDVVKGRIKDALGTENVRGIKEQGKERKAGRPCCVIIDEVDGVVTGSGGAGEGGFMKALIDLVQLDQQNSTSNLNSQTSSTRAKGSRGDSFRLMRPLVLICNDVYAPSLRPLRNSSVAEILHVRKPALDKVVTRLKAVFEKESIPCDNDAVRRLCESSWGMGTRKQNSLGGRGAGEGDIRGILVQGEWVAHKLRATPGSQRAPRLTRKWVEMHLGQTQAASGQRGFGRGGVREVVDRIFVEGAGLPDLPTSLSAEDSRLISESKTSPIGVADLRKRAAINALREMIDTCGDHDRLMTDCFATYPTQVFQDDANLSKPNAGYEWLHFHDSLSSRIFSGQEWELNPYLNTSACGFHHLFAAVDKGDKTWNDDKAKETEENAENHPFSGPKADFAAYEAEKQHRALLTELQSSFSAPLLRLFRSTDAIATELIPNIGRMMAPDVKPVVVGGSGGFGSVASVRKDTEKVCVKNAVRVMSGLKISFEKVRVEVEGGGAHSSAGFAYRMEPPLDTLTTFHTGKSHGFVPAPVRYAVRQVLDQELYKEKLLQNSAARHARSTSIDHLDDNTTRDEDKENAEARAKGRTIQQRAAPSGAKRDFFGRIINNARPSSAGQSAQQKVIASKDEGVRVWVSFNEGYSNAVRKPITLEELIESFDM